MDVGAGPAEQQRHRHRVYSVYTSIRSALPELRMLANWPQIWDLAVWLLLLIYPAVVKKTLLERSIKPSETDIARYEIPLAGSDTGLVEIKARSRL